MIFFFFVETLILCFFCRLLAPTLTLCMVCESACLLVYVTKMYLHNRRRTLEDFWKKKKKQLKKTKPPTATPKSTRQGDFLPLWCANNSKDFVQMTPLRNIWYCSYWVSFPISDFNMFQHLQHVWTVLKRNMLCQTSATSTLTDSSKECSSFKDFWAGTVEKWRLRKKVWRKQKRASSFDCHTHLGQFYIYNHCGSRAILGLHVNG